MRLPNGYQEVEYIQSSGTPGGSGQMINTLYIPTPNTKISIDMQFTSVVSQAGLFGSVKSGGSYLSMIAYINGSLQWSRYMMDGTTDTSTNINADTNRHTFILDKSGFTILTNGSQTYYGSNPYTPTKNGYYPLYLLAYYGGDDSRLPYSSAKLYSCKIYESGTLVRDFVPCYRKSDGEIGLYDLVNNTFYTNAGTGVFAKGNDIGPSGKIQRMYLGTDLIRPNEITETYTLSDGLSLYKSGFKPQSIIYECDYYNPSSGWTGATIKIGDSSVNLGWYLWGGQNIGSYPNSDGKIEYSGTKIYDSTHKYIPKGSTRHLKVTFSREGISLKVENNAEETYLYSSGSWGPSAISIMDSADLHAIYRPSTGSTLSNGVATVTYSKA